MKLSIIILCLILYYSSYADDSKNTIIGQLEIQAALNDGFYEFAEKASEKYLSSTTDKKNSTYKFLLAHALYGQEEYSKILKLIPKSNKDGRSIYWRAKAFEGLGDLKKSLSLLNDSQKGEYEPEIFRLKSLLLHKLGKLEEAEKVCLDFNSSFINHIDFYENKFQLALIYKDQKRFKEAKNIFTELISLTNDISHRSKLNKAAILLKEKENILECEKLLYNLIEDPKIDEKYKIAASDLLAQLELNNSNINEAVIVLEKAIGFASSAEKRLVLKSNLINLLIQKEYYPDALKWIEAAQAEVNIQAVSINFQFEKANILLLLKKYNEASFAFQIILDVVDNNDLASKAYYGRGIALWELNRLKEASLMFEQAYNRSSDKTIKANAIFKAGDSYYKDTNYNKAEYYYLKFSEDFPEHKDIAQAYYQLGLCYARIGRRSNSIEIFKKVYTDFSESIFANQARLRSADVLIAEQNWEIALSMYDQVEVLSDSLETLSFSKYQKGLLLYKLGLYKEAKLLFEEIISKYADSEYAEQSVYMRAFCLYMLDDIEEAIEICKLFVQDRPNSEWTPNVLFWLAEQSYNTRNFIDAEILFLRIYNEFSSHTLAEQALFRAAKSAMNSSKFTLAVERFSLLVRSFSNSIIVPEARFLQGNALAELGDYGRAILAFEEVLKQYPKHELANAALGRVGDCQFILGSNQPIRYNDAFVTYETLLDRIINSHELQLQCLYKLGRCKYKMGDLDESFDYYIRAVYYFINQSVEYTSPNLTWFTRAAFSAAELQEQLGNYKGACAIYERVIDSKVPVASEAKRRYELLRFKDPLLDQNKKELINDRINN